MLLATSTIKAALNDGAIICVPPPQRIEGAHIDITLGQHAWLFDPAKEEETLEPLDISSADPTEWFEPWHAMDGYIWLPAQSTILAHTREYIGTADGSGIVPMLHTRSTLARWGLSVCTANAGQGDEGYCSRWTLEIVNPHQRTILPPRRCAGRLHLVSRYGRHGTALPTRHTIQQHHRAMEPKPHAPEKGQPAMNARTSEFLLTAQQRLQERYDNSHPVRQSPRVAVP